MPTKECPLCEGSMQLRQGEQVVQLPGNPRETTRPVREWVCPDCDYFEEAEEDE